jgi:hypothetical protein
MVRTKSQVQSWPLIVDQTVQITAVKKSLKSIIAIQIRPDGCKALHRQIYVKNTAENMCPNLAQLIM